VVVTVTVTLVVRVMCPGAWWGVLGSSGGTGATATAADGRNKPVDRAD
jgi:hypothetical protein